MTAASPMSSTFQYAPQDAAKAADVPPAFISQLVQLEIVPPDEDGCFSVGDVRRIRLLRTLERAGVPLEGVAEVIRRSELSLGFLDLPYYERLAAAGDVTFEELSEETKVPVELLMVVREAVGSGEPHPQDRIRETELPVIRLIEAQIAEGFRPRVIERWLRVYGDCLRRVAETEGDWWHTEIELPLLATGMNPTEMLEAADHGAVQRIAPFLDKALLGLYHGQQEHAWTKNILDGIEGRVVGGRRAQPAPGASRDLLPGPHGLHPADGGKWGRGSRRARRIGLPDRPAHVDAPRREADQVAGRRGDALLPGAGAGCARGARDGRGPRGV